jgi:hypothetical protein
VFVVRGRDRTTNWVTISRGLWKLAGREGGREG